MTGIINPMVGHSDSDSVPMSGTSRGQMNTRGVSDVSVGEGVAAQIYF